MSLTQLRKFASYHALTYYEYNSDPIIFSRNSSIKHITEKIMIRLWPNLCSWRIKLSHMNRSQLINFCKLKGFDSFKKPFRVNAHSGKHMPLSRIINKILININPSECSLNEIISELKNSINDLKFICSHYKIFDLQGNYLINFRSPKGRSRSKKDILVDIMEYLNNREILNNKKSIEEDINKNKEKKN